MSKTVFELVKIKIVGDISSMISFMRGRSSKGRGFNIGTALIIGVILIAFGFMMVFSFGMAMVLGFQMGSEGCGWLYFPMAFVTSGAFSFIGTVFAAQSYLYDAKDNELLLSMPIKPFDVMMSRMIALYLLNFVYTNLLFIPVGVANGLLFGYNVITFINFIISALMIPMLVTALASIIGYLLGKLAKLIPNKNLMTVILGFATVGLLSLVIVNFGNIIEVLMNEISRVADWTAGHLHILFWYGLATSTEHSLKALFPGIIPILALTAAVSAGVAAFLSRHFTAIVTRKTAMKKKKYVRKPLRRTNIQLALIKKEVGYFLSLPSYVMNAGMSTIMAILLGVGILLRGSVISEWLPTFFPDASTNLLGLAIGSSLALSCTLNDVTAPTVSLEGRTIWILKSTPLDPMKVFFAKALLAPIVCLPGVCFTSAASAIVLDLRVIDVLFIVFIPVLACMFSGFLGVCVNLKLPRFDWTNEITVIKQSLSVIFTLLLSMFFTAIPFTLAIIPSAYLEDFSSLWAYGICIAYFLALVLLELFFLATEGKKIWKELG